MNHISLKELLTRENERVEWKEQVADIDNVLKTITAFANDYANLGGGYVVCGAREGKDSHGFSKVFLTGLDSKRFNELQKKVLADAESKIKPRVVPLTEEIPAVDDPSKGVLVFIVPATDHAHSYRARGKDASTYYIRSGHRTIEAKNSLLLELLKRKREIESWDRRVHPKATADDLDLLALRDFLQDIKLWSSSKTIEDYLTVKISAFAIPLVEEQRLSGIKRPRNFALLLFGKKPQDFFENAYATFSIYPGKDRAEATSERHDLTGTIIHQARRLIDLLNAESYLQIDKTSDTPNKAKYPMRALQEAVVNALAHRDYEATEPVRVTVFSDRIQINSPGSLPRAVDRSKFALGAADPVWRNRTLAFFFEKLQLAQAAGQGIQTILKTMKSEGCPDPVFELGRENLNCILPAHPRHETIMEIREIEDMIAIGKRVEALSRLTDLLSKDPYNFRALDLFCDLVQLISSHQMMYELIRENNLDFRQINLSTLIKISECLANIKNGPPITGYLNKIHDIVSQERLQVQQVIRLVKNLRKFSEDEKIISLISTKMEDQPNLSENPSLLQYRAQAVMNLVKACLETGRDKKASVGIKQRAGELCLDYLRDARKDLKTALQYAKKSKQRQWVTKDLDFWGKLKDSAQQVWPSPDFDLEFLA